MTILIKASWAEKNYPMYPLEILLSVFAFDPFPIVCGMPEH